jgi:ABC-type oligopeptide transport system substrate-binding subunit
MMKNLRRFMTLALALLILLTLAACGASFKYDKEAAVKHAEEIVGLANAKNYQGITDILPENLKAQITADVLSDAWDTLLQSSGAFVGYKSAETSGVTQNGVNYIVVVVTGEYENGNRIFTTTYTTDFKIAALEMA